MESSTGKVVSAGPGQSPNSCDTCKQTFSCRDNLYAHLRKVCVPAPNSLTCGGCSKTFEYAVSTIKHQSLCSSYRDILSQLRQQIQYGGANHQFRTDNPIPSQQILNSFPEEVQPVVRENFGAIRSYSYQYPGGLTITYNIRIADEMIAQLRAIFADVNHAFRISVSAGFILKDTEDGIFTYYHASPYNAVLNIARGIVHSSFQLKLILTIFWNIYKQSIC